jgi:RNA polymerase sporulation-specific sigma factor
VKTTEPPDFESNTGLIIFVINRFFKSLARRPIEEDLFQEGALALLKAIARYDSEKGEFSTYAIPCIRGRMLTYLGKLPSATRRSGKKFRFYSLDRFEEALENRDFIPSRFIAAFIDPRSIEEGDGEEELEAFLSELDEPLREIARDRLDGISRGRTLERLKITEHEYARRHEALRLEARKIFKRRYGTEIGRDPTIMEIEIHSDRVIERIKSALKTDSRFLPLSDRERDVCFYMCLDETNEEIAARLNLDGATARNIVCRVLRKTNLERRSSILPAILGLSVKERGG